MWNELRIELNIGQYLDVVGTARGQTNQAAAERIARYKSGKYTVERPLHLGAALAGRFGELAPALSAYGLPLGDAFQLRDDMLGAFGDSGLTGKPVGDDLREGKPTPMLAIAASRAGKQHAELLDRVGAPDLGEDEVAALQAVLVDTGAQAEIEATITALTDQAVTAIARADIAPVAREELHRARVLRGLARPLKRQLAAYDVERVLDRTLGHSRLARHSLEPRRAPPRTDSEWRRQLRQRRRLTSERRRVVGRSHVTGQLGQCERIGRRDCVAVRDTDEHRGRRARSPAGDTGAVAEHDAVDQVRARAGDEQRDVGAEPAAEHRRRSDLGESRVRVAHQHLGRVAAAARDVGVAVAREVEAPDRTGPRRRVSRHRAPACARPGRATEAKGAQCRPAADAAQG